MRARFVFVLAVALTGCELLFPTHETSGGTGGDATTSGSGASDVGGGGGHAGGGGGANGGGSSETTSASTGGSLPCAAHDVSSHVCADETDAAFCADFNGGGGFRMGWSDLDQEPTDASAHTEGGLDTTVYHSKGGSFRVDAFESGSAFDGHCSDGQASTRLVKSTIPNDATAVHVDFYYKDCDGRPAGTAIVQKLDFNCLPKLPGGGDGDTFGILNWGMSASGEVFQLYRTTDGVGTPIVKNEYWKHKLSSSEWTHVLVDLKIGTNGSARVQFNCEEAFQHDGDTSCPSTHDFSLLIGMYTCTEVPTCKIWFDDVFYTYER